MQVGRGTLFGTITQDDKQDPGNFWSIEYYFNWTVYMTIKTIDAGRYLCRLSQ